MNIDNAGSGALPNFADLRQRFPPVPAPTQGRAQVWLAWTERFADPEALEICRNLLAADELEKWRKFHFERDRKLYLVAHAMVRFVLAAYLDTEPDKLRFTANRYGRPELVRKPGMADVRFNLSHARGLAALVVNCGVDCGIDVEAGRDLGDLAAMAGQVLTAAERDYLWRLPAAERNWAFLKFWTLKEAYIKAQGTGLSQELDRFGFVFGEDEAIHFRPGSADDSRAWQFAQSLPGPEHVLALAFRCGGGPELDTCFCEWLPHRLSGG
ncbi:4'-phosphopantetheinyl transferase family protein [Methylomonas sp. HW2-6]|uniref:4'-phosphopantetheinyl transferase family protein n=1 Tax=Methylomonas sp. HW2-6 TaxID=3376687 RepID=UPI004042A2F4